MFSFEPCNDSHCGNLIEKESRLEIRTLPPPSRSPPTPTRPWRPPATMTPTETRLVGSSRRANRRMKRRLKVGRTRNRYLERTLFETRANICPSASRLQRRQLRLRIVRRRRHKSQIDGHACFDTIIARSARVATATIRGSASVWFPESVYAM